MCCLLGGRCCLLGGRCCLLGDLTPLCLLLRYLTPGLVCISPTLCLLCISPLLCLLCISPTLCLLRTFTNGSLIRLANPLCWLGRLGLTTLLTTTLNIGCTSSMTTRMSS